MDLEASVYLGSATFFSLIPVLVLLPFRLSLAISATIAATGAALAAYVDPGAWG